MNLKELIDTHYNELSKTQKKVAAHVLDHPRQVALKSAQELGAEISVSETTVIRFCYSLNLAGYTELQKVIREQLLNQESSLTSYRQSKVELQQKPHFMMHVMEQDQNMIAETMKGISEKDYDAAIERLSAAKKVYILGLRSSFAAASWLSYAIGLARPNVKLIRPESEDVIQTVSEMDDSTVVIVISFHRYLRETIQIAELAKKQQSFVIGITDSHLAPIRSAADVLFPIYSPNKSTLDATASLFSFMNAIVAGLIVKEKETFEKRQERYRALDSDFLFTEGAKQP
ncbi:MurR/RpiR family transcriptional regulator [Planococcus shixiaomingii]|uniref:MurR/RpiR family transcriptional regulator n=1 Tax=Planococcus shixiaomingii TaxID=3058393 RepID=UPI0026061D75|nr:MurR/RpiR family transcriptional regulator [Planococcus sp. N022]WKA55557.1 MurR/RpiR family transcriptional regulator [Planococcus sp. N022]